MRLFHTSELRHPTARSLHAAWLELQHSNMLLPPAVAEQLAPISAGTIGTDINLAETLLANHRSTDPMHASRRLAEESWWFTMWRKAESPYTIVHPTAIQEDTVTSLLNDIDPRCFPDCHPDEVRRNPDARIVCETVVLDGWLSLHDDLQVIDRIEINRWASEAGHRQNRDRLLLYDSDTTLVNSTYTPDEIQRLVQAGLLACWPNDDDAPAGDVLRSTRRQVAAMTHSGTLRASGQRLLNCLSTHPDPIGLVEDTRELLPSPTVGAERLHPRHHDRPPPPEQPPQPRTAHRRESRRHDGN